MHGYDVSRCVVEQAAPSCNFNVIRQAGGGCIQCSGHVVYGIRLMLGSWEARAWTNLALHGHPHRSDHMGALWLERQAISERPF